MPPFAAIAASEVENNHHVMTSEDKTRQNAEQKSWRARKKTNILRRVGHQTKKLKKQKDQTRLLKIHATLEFHPASFLHQLLRGAGSAYAAESRRLR